MAHLYRDAKKGGFYVADTIEEAESSCLARTGWFERYEAEMQLVPEDKMLSVYDDKGNMIQQPARVLVAMAIDAGARGYVFGGDDE